MKTALIIGANKSIGFEAARQLLQQGYYVYLGARDAHKGQQAVDELRAEGLEAVELLVIDALRDTPHPTHFSVSDALALIREVRPHRAVLTNLHTDLDYAALAARLPPAVVPAYDGLSLSLEA